ATGGSFAREAGSSGATSSPRRQPAPSTPPDAHLSWHVAASPPFGGLGARNGSLPVSENAIRSGASTTSPTRGCSGQSPSAFTLIPRLLAAGGIARQAAAVE